MKKEKGFTLIETLTALVIISIILLSFAYFFIQSNKTTVRNNEQIVVTYLAAAELERAKNLESVELFSNTGSTDKFKKPQTTFVSTYSSNFEKDVNLNSKKYKVKFVADQIKEEFDLRVVTVTVTVMSPDGKTNSSVEGIVKYE